MNFLKKFLLSLAIIQIIFIYSVYDIQRNEKSITNNNKIDHQITRNTSDVSNRILLGLPPLNNKDSIIYMKQALKNDKKTFGKCHPENSLSIEKVLKIEEIQTAEAADSYRLSVKLENKYFKRRYKDQDRFVCDLQMFDKKLNSLGRESIQDNGGPYRFLNKNNYTVVIESHGSFFFECFKVIYLFF